MYSIHLSETRVLHNMKLVFVNKSLDTTFTNRKCVAHLVEQLCKTRTSLIAPEAYDCFNLFNRVQKLLTSRCFCKQNLKYVYVS